MKKVVFLIPARRNSKGFKFKNRKLIDFTLNSIPKEYLSKVYISTDDEELIKKSIKTNINIVDRPVELAQDETTMKEVLQHFIEVENITNDTDVVILYLTYPERTWEDIIKIYEFFKDNKTNSLVCGDEVKEHPYLCFYEKPKLKGELVINHNLYRRQDYPKCFRLSMFVACYKPNIIKKLHSHMFEKNTTFYRLKNKKVDVDNKVDLDLVNKDRGWV